MNGQRTVLYQEHIAGGANFTDFAGWEMPLHYREGILQEHLATRRAAGLFDVSHMGRFRFSGEDVLPFLQHVLSNNAAALEPGTSQYTLIPTPRGGALDDAYLYHFERGSYLLVVNAANRQRDWAHFESEARAFGAVHMEDVSSDLAMLSLQGPKAKDIVTALLEQGMLPEPMRNRLGTIFLAGVPVKIARTGYSGEPLCFELFMESRLAPDLWRRFVEQGAVPVGLGARDTLRLEAGLPLYGHELGRDRDGNEIPLFATSLAGFAVSFSDLKGDFIGRSALRQQHEARRRILHGDYSRIEGLPRRIRAFAVTGKGIAREGSPVRRQGKAVGYVTSGTVVPFLGVRGEGLYSRPESEPQRRAIGFMLVDSTLEKGDKVEIEVRGKPLEALIVPYHIRSEAPPYTRAIPWYELYPPDEEPSGQDGREGREPDSFKAKAVQLLKEAADNHNWRQTECINLIPSEMTPSPAVRMLSIQDPAGRYAEHKKVKAFKDAQVFYYQGTGFIHRVETRLVEEMKRYLGAAEVETRTISGQMANSAVFSAMVDHLNRGNRKAEPRRIRRVMNHHIIRGGHLSAQPMGALRDFVARNPLTETPSVLNFPVLDDDPYRIDLEACRPLLEEYRPELVILGKSMILYREPVRALRDIIDELGIRTVLMYDMAHVLGLAGPAFQDPFREGADIVTGSTHKTLFGSQRGIIAGRYREGDPDWPLWEAVERRSFPGSVSNHHLGTLLGLLMALYEMNAFRDTYQSQTVRNAKAFAAALAHRGLRVAGDPALGYTETHQVVVEVGYAKGPEAARRLEENGIIVNYQATPREEGFSAAGAIRLGVAEMTRFGMKEADFQALADLMADILQQGASRRREVGRLRKKFLEMQYCFRGPEWETALDNLGG